MLISRSKRKFTNSVDVSEAFPADRKIGEEGLFIFSPFPAPARARAPAHAHAVAVAVALAPAPAHAHAHAHAVAVAVALALARKLFKRRDTEREVCGRGFEWVLECFLVATVKRKEGKIKAQRRKGRRVLPRC